MALLQTNKFALLMKDQLTRVINAATGTGASKSQIFTVQETKDSTPINILLVVSGTFTVCTITLQASNDGGTTFNAYSTADTGLDVNAKKFLVLNDLVPGVPYQFTVASITGTSVTVDAGAA